MSSKSRSFVRHATAPASKSAAISPVSAVAVKTTTGRRGRRFEPIPPSSRRRRGRAGGSRRARRRGRPGAQTSRAASPFWTDATTRTSGVTSSRSSRASRKTSLSSTRTTSMGVVCHTGSIGTLLDGKEERIVRLAALVHLDLDLGMRVGDAATRSSAEFAPSPRRTVRTSEASPISRSTTSRATGSSTAPLVTGSPSTRPRKCPCSTSSPFVTASREATVTSPVGRARAAFACRPRSPRRLPGSKATSAASPARVRVGMTTSRAWR